MRAADDVLLGLLWWMNICPDLIVELSERMDHEALDWIDALASAVEALDSYQGVTAETVGELVYLEGDQRIFEHLKQRSCSPVEAVKFRRLATRWPVLVKAWAARPDWDAWPSLNDLVRYWLRHDGDAGCRGIGLLMLYGDRRRVVELLRRLDREGR